MGNNRDRKCLVFFNVDNPRVRRRVSKLGKVVSLRQCDKIDNYANFNYVVFKTCMEGSPEAEELGEDKRYVCRELVGVGG